MKIHAAIKIIIFCEFLVIGIFYLGTSYFVSCVKNSIELNKILDPLKIEFICEAERGPESITECDPEYRCLDYGGRLDNILIRRDKILKENYGITLGGWWVHMGGWGFTETIVSWAFCYNPFQKIHPEEYDSAKPLGDAALAVNQVSY